MMAGKTLIKGDRVQYVGPPSFTQKLALKGTVAEVDLWELEARIEWDNPHDGDPGWYSFAVLTKVL